MITYDMERRGELPLYEYLYLCIRRDIESGAIGANEKLPSKRNLAKHLGVSLITVEGAYTQLIAEGYLRGVERRGYYACTLPQKGAPTHPRPSYSAHPLEAATDTAVQNDALAGDLVADFRGGSVAPGTLPYDLWAKALRSVLSQESESSLMVESDSQGSPRLRTAICNLLRGFRGMEVDPSQVFVGAGAQYLYHMLVQLLGRDRCVAVEDPGYPRLGKIYAMNGLDVRPVPMDDLGIRMDALAASGADIAHIMPSHQYPTGLTTTISRRYELLGWAAEKPGRVIVEDDYDCEFRLAGRPIPALQSIDAAGQVVYANTFTKTLGPGFRMGYLVLPPALADLYRKNLGFYSCTVGALDQLALARFIETGAYERHVNRMRAYYRNLQNQLVDALQGGSCGGRLSFKALESGLHFLMGVQTEASAEKVVSRAAGEGVALLPLERFRTIPLAEPDRDTRWFVMNYAGLKPESVLPAADALGRAFGAL